MRPFILGVCVLVAACGSSSSPAAPSSPPPSPPAPPPVMPAASLTLDATRKMEFPKFDPQSGWTFLAQGQNTGQGCAGTVKGTAKFIDPSGATLQTIEFSLEASKRVLPAETFVFQGCCLTEANGRAGGTVVISFSWENVACQ